MYDFSKKIERSNTNAEKYTLRKTLFGTEDVLPAWVADMDIATPPFVLDAVKKRLEHPIVGYEEFPQSAKEAQCAWIERHHSKHFEPSQLLYSHSVVASMSVAIQAFSEKGDRVIVQTPVYPPFFHPVTLNGRMVLRNPLKKREDGSYTFDLDHLRSSITDKTKLLLLCNPHNPVGRVWKKEELEALLEICKEHNIIVFSDEIHCDLVYEPHKHTPFASLSGADKLCISAFGPGKTFNMAGFAISTVAIENDELMRRYKAAYDAIHFAQGAALSHVAFETAFKEGDEWLKELKVHLWHNYTRLQKLLEKFRHLIRLTPLEATYLAWLDCQGMHLKDKELREWFVKEAKLGLNAGLSFGREGSGHMRLNFAVPSETMDEILKRLERALNRYEN